MRDADSPHSPSVRARDSGSGSFRIAFRDLVDHCSSNWPITTGDTSDTAADAATRKSSRRRKVQFYRRDLVPLLDKAKTQNLAAPIRLSIGSTKNLSVSVLESRALSRT